MQHEAGAAAGAGLEDILRRVVDVLDEAKIPFMIAGSFASNMHGTPRPTQDLDLVVDLDEAGLEALLTKLPADAYYVDADAARRALLSRGTFNVVDLATSLRVDFIVKKDRPFSRQELARRAAREVHGVPAFVASAEDTIIAELEWSKGVRGSETQLRNVAAILAVRRDSLDLAYVQRWVKELGLEDEWKKLGV
jgi:hypothetical protein